MKKWGRACTLWLFTPKEDAPWSRQWFNSRPNSRASLIPRRRSSNWFPSRSGSQHVGQLDRAVDFDTPSRCPRRSGDNLDFASGKPWDCASIGSHPAGNTTLVSFGFALILTPWPATSVNRMHRCCKECRLRSCRSPASSPAPPRRQSQASCSEGGSRCFRDRRTVDPGRYCSATGEGHL